MLTSHSKQMCAVLRHWGRGGINKSKRKKQKYWGYLRPVSVDELYNRWGKYAENTSTLPCLHAQNKHKQSRLEVVACPDCHFVQFIPHWMNLYAKMSVLWPCGTIFWLQDYSLPLPHWDSTQDHFHVGPAHITHAVVSITAFVAMATT